MTLPEVFTRSLGDLDVDAGALAAALGAPSPVAIRFNPYKVADKPAGRQVPWNRYGFYLNHRPSFTLDPAFHSGLYYVQEPSSMFVEHLARQFAGFGQRPLRILDLCAAPGGKSTLMAAAAGLESVVVANETVRSRAFVLAENVRRWGLGNVVVTNNDPSRFDGFRDWFDIILVDAPCSGEGMFCKDPQAVSHWSPSNVELCAARQRRIVADIWPLLKPGGMLIYSTCTFNRVENEDNVGWFARELGALPAPSDPLPESWGVVGGESGSITTYRFYPHLTEGEGFFAATMVKEDGRSRTRSPKPRRSVLSRPAARDAKEASSWIVQPSFMEFAQGGGNIYAYYAEAAAPVRTLCDTMSVIYSGVLMGQVFNGKLRPEHPLALFHDLDRKGIAVAELTGLQALDYLRKKDTDPSLYKEGINLVASEGMPLGWIKRIGNRCNNMLPKEARILNL